MEKAGGRHVVQYRGKILPLIHLSSALAERRQEARISGSPLAKAEDEKIRVVVYTDQGRSVGLVVDRILDIATRQSKPRKTTAGPKLGNFLVRAALRNCST